MNKKFFRNAVTSMTVAIGMLLAASSRAELPGGMPRITETQVVSIAAVNNPGLRSAMLEYQSAQWSVVAEEARFALVLEVDGGVTFNRDRTELLGTTSTSHSYTASAGAELRKHLIWGTDLSFRVEGSPPPVVPEGQANPGYGFAARFAVVQPLLRGAGREVGEADLLAAQARRTSAEHARDRAASDLLRNVLTAYWELWYAGAAAGIQEQSKALAQKQRDEAAARAESGSLAPADVLSFDTRVATREEEIVNAYVERDRRQLELYQQLGTLDKAAATGLPAEQVPPTPVPLPGDVEKAALAESPQIRELEAAVELSRLQARTAEDPHRHRLDLDASVQAQGRGYGDVGAAFKQFGTFGAGSVRVGLTYEAALDPSGRQAAAAKARLAVEMAEQRLAEAKQSIMSAVRVALRQEEAGRKKLALAEETARIAEKQLAAEQARFQSGASTPLTILEAEDAVRSANLRVARARAELLQTSLSLQHLTGRLLAKYASHTRAGRPQTGSFRGTSPSLMTGTF
jgi:outer membrane protein TolC